VYNTENGRKAGVEQIDISKGLISDVCIKLYFSCTTYWYLALRSLFYVSTAELSIDFIGGG
jgi:hypothetical protein